jgi:hypothetical protein
MILQLSLRVHQSEEKQNGFRADLISKSLSRVQRAGRRDSGGCWRLRCGCGRRLMPVAQQHVITHTKQATIASYKSKLYGGGLRLR